MAKTGRKNKYETYVKPYLNKVTEYARTMLERDIAKALGVSADSFITYKKEHPELDEAVRKGQQCLVADLRSALIKRAFGYDYEETDTEFVPDENGNIKCKRKVIHKRHIAEDKDAIDLLLNNYDKDNWYKDWKALEIKKEQLEIDKKVAEMKTQGW